MKSFEQINGIELSRFFEFCFKVQLMDNAILSKYCDFSFPSKVLALDEKKITDSNTGW